MLVQLLLGLLQELFPLYEMLHAVATTNVILMVLLLLFAAGYTVTGVLMSGLSESLLFRRLFYIVAEVVQRAEHDLFFVSGFSAFNTMS